MPAAQAIQTPTDAAVSETFAQAEKHFGQVTNLVRVLGSNPPLCKSITEFFIQAIMTWIEYLYVPKMRTSQTRFCTRSISSLPFP